MRVGQISNHELGQSQKLAGFCAQGLVCFTAQDWLVLVLSWSETGCVSLALTSESEWVSLACFQGHGVFLCLALLPYSMCTCECVHVEATP